MLDGLYIDDYDAAGNETPEMTLTLAVQLEGSVSIKIFRVGIYGGVSITIAGDLNDPNQDGKLRIKEIRAVENPICLFELSGWLDFFFGFFVEVDLFIKNSATTWSSSASSRRSSSSRSSASPSPRCSRRRAHNLELMMGEANTAARNIADRRDQGALQGPPARPARGRNGQRPAKTGQPLVSVEAFGLYQEFTVPAGGRIVADAGTANDTIELPAGVDLAGRDPPVHRARDRQRRRRQRRRHHRPR